MRRYPWAFPLLLFFLILLHGSVLGLTDDEAYYWVLAQKPAWGYAYHPPAMALFVAASQKLFSWIDGANTAFIVRFPAAASMAALLALGMRWLERAGAPRGISGAWILVSLVGIFGLSWMMVPDTPLFLGWMLAFVATWEVCQSPENEFSARSYFWMAGGVALAILSKYSGGQGALSAVIAIGLWAPAHRKRRGILAVIVGCFAAAMPILYWNAMHGWVSLLYQLRERHGDIHLSGIRYLRFWLIECVIAGPGLVVFSFDLVKRGLIRKVSRPELFALAWAAPGMVVFFSQPLWSDFKPHWALIAWWPLILAMAWSSGVEHRFRRLVRWQVGYGVTLGALVFLSCHLPVMAWVVNRVTDKPMDPRMDVTNDLYGWAELPGFIAAQGGAEEAKWPILGVRYQTAAQAAFAQGPGAQVSLLPRDLRAMDEWPSLAVADGQGPDWPKLLKPVLFVADNRYDSEPAYREATCTKTWTLEKMRWGLLAKRIFVWRCVPSGQ
ncbi:hypothetical protein WDW37_19265 [Bdellovibrionota bacterium FG-1]